MLHVRRLVCTLGVLVFAGAACRHGAETREGRAAGSSEVVAKVDDAVITVAEVEARINKQPQFIRVRYADPAKKRQLLDELVQNEALAAEAARHGYDRDPDVQRAVKEQMVAKLVKMDFESKLKVEDVPDAEVEKYYNDHPADFHQKPAVGVLAILVKSKAKADRAYARAETLPKGPDNLEEQQERFRELVTKDSDVPESKFLAGDLLFFYEDSTVVPGPIVEAAFKLRAVGDLAPPIRDRPGLGGHSPDAEAARNQSPAPRGQAANPAAPVPRPALESAQRLRRGPEEEKQHHHQRCQPL